MTRRFQGNAVAMINCRAPGIHDVYVIAPDLAAGNVRATPSASLSEIMMDMPFVDTPTLRVPKVDPHLSGAGERVKVAAAELERLGIANFDGTWVRTDLPGDMEPGVQTVCTHGVRTMLRPGSGGKC